MRAAFDFLIALLFTAAVITADYKTGVKMSFSLFYLAPVGYIAWQRGLRWGLAFAAFCVLARLVTDFEGGKAYASQFIAIWNTCVRAGVLTFTAIVMSKVRRSVVEAQAARTRAQAASRAKSEFLWSMSHEIRTPLTGLLAMAELLADTELTERQAEYVRTFRAEGKTLLNLIGDLLDSAKVEEGHYLVERVPFSLAELMAEVGSTLGAQARLKGLAFRLELAPGLPGRIIGDPLLLKRTILNLGGNAVKFTARGEIIVEASRVLRSAGSTTTLRFVVTDTGIGIPADRLAALFQPFVQADESTRRHYGGTGLGLSLCKRFVELMGGCIEVTSVEGQGSRFAFELPLEVAAPAAATEGGSDRAPSPSVATEVGELHQLRILVADDHSINREIVKGFLRPGGCIVEEAVDGREALEMVKNNNYDLAFLDVQMPVLDGHDAARSIRAYERQTGRRPLPLVALTAHAAAEDVEQSRRAGFDSHMTKPFTKAQLIAQFGTLGLRPTSTFDTQGGQPAVTAAAAAEEVVSPGGIAADPELAAILPLFFADLDRLLDAANSAVRNGDWEELGVAGHKIKGAAGSFGFPRVSTLGGELEDVAGLRDAIHAQGLLESLRRERQEVDDGRK